MMTDALIKTRHEQPASPRKSDNPRRNRQTAQELESYSAQAMLLENAVAEAVAVLHAVYTGGLLDALPEGEEEAANHNAACTLLSALQRRLNDVEVRIEEARGTNLSIFLSTMADDAKRTEALEGVRQ